RFLAIAVLLDVKDIPQVGPLQWGWISTPLITTKPAFRAASFLFSAFLIVFALIVPMLILAQLAGYFFTGGWSVVPAEVVLLFIPGSVLYAWMFWLGGNFLDVVWRLICRVLWWPLAWLSGRDRSLVYGPSPSKLKSILWGPPILLLTPHNDEADVLLQVGSAPARFYLEYVRTFSRPGRALEFAFLRPFMLGTFLKVVKMLLEISTLGFSAWRTLVQDFDVVGRPY